MEDFTKDISLLKAEYERLEGALIEVLSMAELKKEFEDNLYKVKLLVKELSKYTEQLESTRDKQEKLNYKFIDIDNNLRLKLIALDTSIEKQISLQKEIKLDVENIHSKVKNIENLAKSLESTANKIQLSTKKIESNSSSILKILDYITENKYYVLVIFIIACFVSSILSSIMTLLMIKSGG